MSGRIAVFIIRLSLVVMGAVTLLSSVACGDIGGDLRGIYPVTIENRTSQVLSIYINGVPIFDIGPGEERAVVSRIGLGWLVTAKNAQGETVFSQEVKPEQVKRRDGSTYVIVILPVDKGAGSSNTTIAK